MNHAVITQMNNHNFVLIYEEDALVECHPFQMENALQIGNIYIGRVEKVVKNIQSAFIRLDSEHVGYLPLNDQPALVLNRTLPKGLPSIAESDLILVQVEQEPQKMKQARVTGNISLNGNYVVLDFQKGYSGVSKKIKNKSRYEELKQLISDDTYGYVLRTACEHADNSLILDEYNDFKNMMDQLIHQATYERKTGCIRSGKPEYVMLLEEYGIDRLEHVQTDIPEIASCLQSIGTQNVIFYDKTDYPLYKLLGLETTISHLLSKKVWLKSGGFLMIEPTEAMVVIDVNTGKSIGKKNPDTHIMKINEEAAIEICKQIRLRNLSGIILVDFINMRNTEYKQKLIHTLKHYMAKDKVATHFIDVTKLDLYEITRKKVRKPIYELL
ncbi:MAG: ribonuclease E/G [Oscillospiraceae bacterium]|nr:ribonuclease E/G [Oscillospiraceae bacterium]